MESIIILTKRNFECTGVGLGNVGKKIDCFLTNKKGLRYYWQVTTVMILNCCAMRFFIWIMRY